VIGVLVNSYGIDQAEGFLHWFEGWIIFISCMAILFSLAWTLQRFTREPKSMLGMLDLDSAGLAAPAQSFLKLRGSQFGIAVAFLSVFAGAIWTMMPRVQSFVPDRTPLAVFPMEIEGWKGKEFRNEASIEVTLGADEYLRAEYVAPEGGSSIEFFTAFYNSTTDGTGIHNPEICIPGGGWEVSNWQRKDVTFKSAEMAPLRVNRAIITRDGEKRIVYYWFHMRGETYASEYAAKLNTIWDSMTQSRADGALVRFIAPIQPGETENQTEERLLAFMPNIIRKIPEYVPN
jgi:exosortase D (VPLPA-CTERM-specific)